MGWTNQALAPIVRLHLARGMLANRRKISTLQAQVDAIKARHMTA